MKIGTRSLLYGAHQFMLHPLFLALAWRKLYGAPLDPRLWVALALFALSIASLIAFFSTGATFTTATHIHEQVIAFVGVPLRAMCGVFSGRLALQRCTDFGARFFADGMSKLGSAHLGFHSFGYRAVFFTQMRPPQFFSRAVRCYIPLSRDANLFKGFFGWFAVFHSFGKMPPCFIGFLSKPVAAIGRVYQVVSFSAKLGNPIAFTVAILCFFQQSDDGLQSEFQQLANPGSPMGFFAPSGLTDVIQKPVLQRELCHADIADRAGAWVC